MVLLYGITICYVVIACSEYSRQHDHKVNLSIMYQPKQME
jgi:hypothetical protein